jgi:hypothetical protein
LASYILPCNWVTGKEVEKALSWKRCDFARELRFRRDLTRKAGNHCTEPKEIPRGGDSEDKTPTFD